MRIRTIKPEFWTSPDVAELTREARLLFIGCWSVADDHGYLEDQPGRLLLQLFPGDRDMDTPDVDGWLDELIGRGMLQRLQDEEGRRLLRVVNWTRHQRIDRPSRSRFAVPEGSPQRRLPVDPEAVKAPEGVGIAETAGGAKRPKRKKVDPDTLPEDFEPRLAAYVEPVRAILLEITEGNGARGAVVPTTRALAMALADFPHRDFLPVARDYRAWQLAGKARSPHRDAVKGYRNQLRNAPDVLRPEPPTGSKPGGPQGPSPDARERTERALREMES